MTTNRTREKLQDAYAEGYTVGYLDGSKLNKKVKEESIMCEKTIDCRCKATAELKKETVITVKTPWADYKITEISVHDKYNFDGRVIKFFDGYIGASIPLNVLKEIIAEFETENK